jgi:hypothetical protein
MKDGKSVAKWCTAKCDSPYTDIERSCENYEPMTNADMIRKMEDEQLAENWPCPYDTAGSNIMPCMLDDDVKGAPTEECCHKCIMNWLQKEVKE